MATPKSPRTRTAPTPLAPDAKKPAARPRARLVAGAAATPEAAPAAAIKAAPKPRARAVIAPTTRTVSLPFMAYQSPADRMLGIAIGASVLLHAVVLALHFSPLEFSHADRNTPPLEVALVNAKSTTKPTKAELLAQAHLDGGGNTDADRSAKSPLPILPKDSPNNELAVATQRVEDLEEHTKELMTQLKALTAVNRPQQAPTDAPEKTDLPTATELMQQTLEAMRLEAQIAKDMDAYQKRPKRRFVGARAQEYRFARYVEDWRLRVERVGNQHYPEAARVQKLYGSLLLTVGIRANGSIEGIVVDRSSGQKILDLAATRIVQMGAPYAPFPPDIQRDTDILYITRTWTFAPGDSLISR